MFGKFFNKVIYSSCNEDSNSERKALSIHPKDTILCITASGARTLDLLIDNPEKIISIDFNASQNYLLELKIACYKSLSYKEFRNFLGITAIDRQERKRTYDTKLRDQLFGNAQEYWDQNITLIQKGVLYQGTWDKILLLFAKVLNFRKKKLNKLFSATSIKEQSKIWKNEWDTPVWRILLRFSSSKFIWKHIFHEPGVEFIPQGFNAYKYMHQRFNYLGENLLLSEAHFASLLFCGKYNSDGPLPLHLQEKNYHTIRKNLDRIEIHTISLGDIVKNKEIMSSVTALSLSDFGSYCDDDTYINIWENITKTCVHNTKFCERQFLIKRNPKIKNTYIQRDSQVEKHLHDTDTTVFYSFVAGVIFKK